MAPSAERWADLEAYARSQGLNDAAAEAYATLAWWTEHYGVAAPPITSGLRSAAYQAQLRARWDAGDRSGLVTRPALYSNHTRGEAFDIPRGPALDFFAHFAPYLGVRWGGKFSQPDPVHFDLGTG